MELLFRELESHSRLEELPSRKPQVVKALVYASALTLLVSRCLLNAVRQALGQAGEWLKSHRWAVLLSMLAADLLLLVLRPPRETRLLHRHFKQLLLHEAPDPNVLEARYCQVRRGTSRRRLRLSSNITRRTGDGRTYRLLQGTPGLATGTGLE